MLPFKLVYHEGYDLNLGAHVFPSQKYHLVKEALVSRSLAGPEDFLRPEPAADQDILLVHSLEWVRKLKSGRLSPVELMRLEIPWSNKMVEACWLAAGGSILAARRALADGFAMNLGGGLHHAYPDHGEGFCAIHDVAVAIRRVQQDKAIVRVMIVDTDVHHGNGTAAIFGGEEDVFTLSIHQENNYPYPKPHSTIDLHLPDGTGDDDYLAILEKGLLTAFHDFSPDLLFYIGGADPYREDQLGGLALTIPGLESRDAMVFDHARRHGVPVAITLAGGYARDIKDTVQIHVNTFLAAREIASRRPAAGQGGVAVKQQD